MVTPTVIRIALSVLCLAIAPAASALTIEGPFATSRGSGQVLTSFASTGLDFLEVSDTSPFNVLVDGRLFPSLVLTPDSVGTTVYADASAGEQFQLAVTSLTDGRPGDVLIGWPPTPGSAFTTGSGSMESQIFASDPLGTGGVDLAGFRIDRIGFRLDRLVLDSPGSNPNGDGIWTDVQIDGTLVFDGERVPEAGPAAFAALGLTSLLLRRTARAGSAPRSPTRT